MPSKQEAMSSSVMACIFAHASKSWGSASCWGGPCFSADVVGSGVAGGWSGVDSLEGTGC